MGRLDRVARGVLRPINPYATVLLGIYTLLWGLWLISPFWNTFGRADLFRHASEFAPEWAWGSWSFVAGATVVAAIFRGRFSWLSFALAFISWHWWTIGSLLLWGDWQNTGGLTYLFIAIYSTYAYLNIEINYVKFNEELPSFDD